VHQLQTAKKQPDGQETGEYDCQQRGETWTYFQNRSISTTGHGG
jgi:hypothetical protein